MVVTRWESSSRPLFVKTVWRDGHHHVVLQEEDGQSPARSSRRSVASTTSQRSVKKTHQKTEASSNFKVSSVKLLLAGLRNSKKRCKTESYSRGFVNTPLTIDIIPSDSVRYSDINKQVSFDNVRHQRLSTKATSLEVSQFNEEVATPPPFSYDNYHTDQSGTSLSERVMIWLDLAVQNHKDFKNFDLKKRVVTAQACPIFQKKTTKNLHDYKREFNAKMQEKYQQPRKNISILKTDLPLVTSHIEFDDVSEIDVERSNKIRKTTKRQLHIFLPTLPKKTSESSILSSKAGSFQTSKT